MRNKRDQYKTSSNFGGNSYSEWYTGNSWGKSERKKIAVFLWPVSSASLQDCRLGPFLWFLLLVSLCKCHRAVIRRRSEWHSNYMAFFSHAAGYVNWKQIHLNPSSACGSFHPAKLGSGDVHQEEERRSMGGLWKGTRHPLCQKTFLQFQHRSAFCCPSVTTAHSRFWCLVLLPPAIPSCVEHPRAHPVSWGGSSRVQAAASSCRG